MPLRTCVLCRKKLIKWDLYRFVLKSDKIYHDPKQFLPGKGAYLCHECFSKKDDPKVRARLIKVLKKEENKR
jgi:predicted RNA-binding protein YlxR (DUF448 family)